MKSPGTTPEPARRSERLRACLRSLRAIASHPLLLLAVGAVVSGLLVPTLTRGAQNHRQALGIKSDLVDSMTSAVGPWLAATLANEIVYNGEVPRSYDRAYQQWYAQSSEVAAKLRTYFPDAEATTRWFSFSARMKNIYYFFRLGTTPEGRRSGARAAYVDRTKTFLRELPACKRGGICPMVSFAGIDAWLATPKSARHYDDGVNFSIEELLQAYEAELGDIVDSVLNSTPRL